MPSATQTKPAKVAAESAPKGFRIVTLADRSSNDSAFVKMAFRRTIRKRDGSSYTRSFPAGEIVMLDEFEAEYLAPDIATGIFNMIELSPSQQRELLAQLGDQATLDRLVALNGAVMELALQVERLGAKPVYTVNTAGELVCNEEAVNSSI